MKAQLTPRSNRYEPNLVIDGGMELWPEGTSRTIANNATAYGAVLFKNLNADSGVTLTNSQQASVPSGTNIPFSNQVSKTAAGTAISTTAIGPVYVIEGYDTQKILNNEFSVIFWVKSTVASNRSLAVRNATSSHSYVQQYNISATNTWQLKVIRLPALSTCPGTLDKANGVGARINWSIVSGSASQTSSLNQWVTGSFISGTGEDTTWATGTTHDFSIAGVMVLPGDWTTLTVAQYNFLRAGKHWQEEVARSQRYFEKTYDDGTNPGAVTFNGAVNAHPGSLSGTSTTGANWQFKVSKRASPTITIYGSFGGATNDVSITANASPPETSDVAGTVYHTGTNGTSARPTAAVAIQSVSYHGTADARF